MSTTKVHLAGKNAIVTGAAVGLGASYARALCQQHVNVALCDIREEVATLAKELASDNSSTVAFQGDVSDPEFVRRVVDGTQQAFGGIDILINNAGVWGASVADDNLDKSLDDYERIIGTNLKAEYLFGRAVIPLLLAQGRGGDIVNIATDHMVTCGTPWQVCPQRAECPWADAPRPTGGGEAMDLYDASKWGLNGLLYAWAKSLAPHGIRVNQFCMGATDSHMLRSFHNFAPSAAEEASWMRATDNAQVLIELLQEGPQGRNAQNINFCVGRPVQLEPPLAQTYVLESHIQVRSAS